MNSRNENPNESPGQSRTNSRLVGTKVESGRAKFSLKFYKFEFSNYAGDDPT